MQRTNQPVLVTLCLVITLLAASVALLAAPGVADAPLNIAYVANADQDTLLAIDLASQDVVTTTLVGDLPIGVAASPLHDYVAVANHASHTVSLLETASGKVVATVPVGKGPYDLLFLPDGKTLLVGNHSASSISFFDTATRSVTATVSLEGSPYHMAVQPASAQVYIAANTGIMVLDTASKKVTHPVQKEAYWRHIALSPDGKTAFVLNNTDRTLNVLDAATNTFTKTLSMPGSVEDIVLADGGKTAYATLPSEHTVAKVDLSADAVSASIPVGARPFQLALSADERHLFVSHERGNVTVVTLSDSTTATITVEGWTSGIAVAGAVVSAPTPTPTPTELEVSGASFPIYDNELHWENWSWGTDIAEATVAGDDVLAFTYQVGWGAINLYVPGFHTSPYDNLEFETYIGELPLATLSVAAYTGNGADRKLQAQVNPESYASRREDGWYDVSIPLSDLQVKDTLITGVQIQEFAGVVHSTFHLDNLQFVPVGDETSSPSIDVWWPLDDATLTGATNVQALLGDRPIENYSLALQVDGRYLGKMTELSDHEALTVDPRGWNWNGDGPYELSVIAMSNDGSFIGRRSLQLQVPQPKREIEVWWPKDGSSVTDHVPFMAILSNTELSAYEMSLTVENTGPTYDFINSDVGSPHKEITVDSDTWTGSNPYEITLTARDLSGTVIAQKVMHLLKEEESAPTPAPTAEPTITLTPSPTAPSTPAPTPTPEATGPSGEVLFVCYDSSNKSQICKMNWDGSSRVMLTSDSLKKAYPSWSPDGKQIVYAAYNPSISKWAIYRMNADGTGQVRLSNPSETHTTVNHSDLEPQWSPDGQKIVFTSGRDGDLEIWTMNPDGTGQTQITQNREANDREPAWATDAKIVFTSDRTGRPQIWSVNLDGTDQRQLTEDDIAKGHPRSSSQGEWTVYEAGNQIAKIRIDGTQATQLTTTTDENSSPSWAPDGSTILFSSSRGATRQIYQMNADGSNVQRFPGSIGPDYAPAWKPGSKPPVHEAAVRKPLPPAPEIQQTHPATCDPSETQELSPSFASYVERFKGLPSSGGTFFPDHTDIGVWHIANLLGLNIIGAVRSAVKDATDPADQKAFLRGLGYDDDRIQEIYQNGTFEGRHFVSSSAPLAERSQAAYTQAVGHQMGGGTIYNTLGVNLDFPSRMLQPSTDCYYTADEKMKAREAIATHLRELSAEIARLPKDVLEQEIDKLDDGQRQAYYYLPVFVDGTEGATVPSIPVDALTPAVTAPSTPEPPPTSTDTPEQEPAPEETTAPNEEEILAELKAQLDYLANLLEETQKIVYEADGLAKEESPVSCSTYYTVQAGDTLSSISKHYYGDTALWWDIYDANRHVIGLNPNLITVGQTFCIPGPVITTDVKPAETVTSASEEFFVTTFVVKQTPDEGPSVLVQIEKATDRTGLLSGEVASWDWAGEGLTQEDVAELVLEGSKNFSRWAIREGAARSNGPLTPYAESLYKSRKYLGDEGAGGWLTLIGVLDEGAQEWDRRGVNIRNVAAEIRELPETIEFLRQRGTLEDDLIQAFVDGLSSTTAISWNVFSSPVRIVTFGKIDLSVTGERVEGFMLEVSDNSGNILYNINWWGLAGGTQ